MSRFFEEILRNERLSLDELGVLERARESGKQYGRSLLLGGMIKDEDVATTTVSRLADYYKFHGHPIDAFEAEQQLNLKIVHCAGLEWKSLRTLRDQYQAFVGQPGILPGAMVVSAVETDSVRSWRQVALETSEQSRLVFDASLGQLRR